MSGDGEFWGMVKLVFALPVGFAIGTVISVLLWWVVGAL